MSALALRILALVCMTLDHIGFCLPALRPLRIVGRLAFPIYTFLLTNGYRHTHSPVAYAGRLGLFSLLSQVPYSLFVGKAWTEQGSVYVTLLCALLVVWLVDRCKKPLARALSLAAALGLCVLMDLGVVSTDYGAKGILLALAFWAFGRRPLLLIPACFAAVFHVQLFQYGQQLLLQLTGRPQTFALPSQWTQTQLWSLLALVPILAYNGKKGRTPRARGKAKLLQYAFYLYYPAHMLLLHWTIG